MKFREFYLREDNKILLGKDEGSNDTLMKKFEGKENIILHTAAAGSPFGVIVSLKDKAAKKDILLGGAIVASYSQDWRDNKGDVNVHVFTGKDVSKPKNYKPGSWKVKKFKIIKIKKDDIIKFEKSSEGR